MAINNTSLIQKIISRRLTLTPFEAIHLKYLFRKGILENLINTDKSKDLYQEVDEINKPLSNYMVEFLVQRTREKSPDIYRKYNLAYEYMIDQDENSSKRGYMGLMLITQLRLIKSEFHNYFPKKTTKPLLDFDSYSYYHQDVKTFTDILKTLGETFRLFIQDIDNVLILNFFLRQLVETEDFICLKLLKMWLSKPKSNYDQNFEYMNGAYICCSPEIIQLILDKNHQNYVESIERKIGKLPTGFAEESLYYVQDIIKEVLKTIGKDESTHSPLSSL